MIPRNFLVGWVELEKISRLVVLDKTRYLAWGSKEIALKAFEFSKTSNSNTPTPIELYFKKTW